MLDQRMWIVFLVFSDLGLNLQFKMDTAGSIRLFTEGYNDLIHLDVTLAAA